MFMLEIQVNMGLLSSLAERLDSETCSFHLSTDKMSVTLEDVYKIMRI